MIHPGDYNRLTYSHTFVCCWAGEASCAATVEILHGKPSSLQQKKHHESSVAKLAGIVESEKPVSLEYLVPLCLDKAVAAATARSMQLALLDKTKQVWTS